MGTRPKLFQSIETIHCYDNWTSILEQMSYSSGSGQSDGMSTAWKTSKKSCMNDNSEQSEFQLHVSDNLIIYNFHNGSMAF